MILVTDFGDPLVGILGGRWPPHVLQFLLNFVLRVLAHIHMRLYWRFLHWSWRLAEMFAKHVADDVVKMLLKAFKDACPKCLDPEFLGQLHEETGGENCLAKTIPSTSQSSIRSERAKLQTFSAKIDLVEP